MFEELKRGKFKEEVEKVWVRLCEEMIVNFEDFYEKIGVFESLILEVKVRGGFLLYFFGGGFRGWGYLLFYMS